MKELKISLTKEQAKHFESIQWLTNPMGPRGSGRTYLLALSFIVHSLNFRTWVIIYDHEYPNTKRDLVHQIERIVFGIKNIKVSFRGIHNIYTEILVTPIENNVYAGVKYEQD